MSEGDFPVRVWSAKLLCIGAGLACGANLHGQTQPEPMPAQSQPPKVYVPTYSPMPGAPAPPAPTPNGNFAKPGSPVVPVSGANPSPLSRAILSAPALEPTAGSFTAAPSVQAPCVLIEKRGPETAYLGQPLQYEIIVRNPGPSPAYNVRVEEELPPPVKFVGSEPQSENTNGRPTWSLGNMEPNSERRIRLQVQPPGEGELRTCATVTFSGTASLRTQVVQPRVAIAVRSPEQVSAGETVPIQIQLSNSGAVAVSNLVVRGRLSDGLQHPQGSQIEAEIGTLAAGETRSITLTATAIRGGGQTCEVIASAGGIEAAGRASMQVLEPNLQLRRSGPTRCYLKGEIGFELEAGNPGTAPANNVVVTDTLPTGLDFVLASEGGTYDPAARTITWRVPSMSPGARRTLTYRVKATALGEHVDRAAIRADAGAIVRAEGTFQVEGIAAMSLEVVDLEDPIEVGGELTYEVRIVNQGSSPCTNIQIIAQVPDGMQARDGSGPTAYRVQGTQATFEPLARLATKADAVYRIKVRGLVPGDYRFRVQMTCDQLKQPVVKEESSRVY